MTEAEMLQRFKKNIERELIDARMTQKDLSEESGISESTISRIMRCESTPNLKNIVNICYALDCDIEDLVDMFGPIE